MFGALVLALLMPQCMAVDNTSDTDMWNAFEQLKPEMERLGITQEVAMGRIDIFKRNYDAFVKLKKETEGKNLALNMMAFLDKDEKNRLIDRNNMMNKARSKRVRRSAAIKYIKADVDDILLELNITKQFNLNFGGVPNHWDTTKTKISRKDEGFPDSDRDATSPGGFAFAAAWTIDVLDILYGDRSYDKINARPKEWSRFDDTMKESHEDATDSPTAEFKNRPWATYPTEKPGYSNKFLRWARKWTWYSVSRAQLFNCVYREHGFKYAGSPADALQWMSDNVIVMSMKQKPHGVNTGDQKLDSMVMIDNLLKWQDSSSVDPSCEPNAMDITSMKTMQNITFLPGKAYINFGDDVPTNEIIDTITYNQTSVDSNNVVTNVETKEQIKADVMGEKLIKPLVYRKGAVLIKMPSCDTLMSWMNNLKGPCTFDCTLEPKINRRYDDMWVVIIGYARTYFRVGNLPWHSRHSLKISRLAEHKYIAHWGHLILPRVKKYTNNIEDNCGCENGGRCAPNNVNVHLDPIDPTENQYHRGSYYCYCPIGKVGPRCTDDCTLNCQNGGYCQGDATQCKCPKGFYGPLCDRTCNCGMFGTCDLAGVCSCPRQVSWGPNCENNCQCGGKFGYCHADGSCDCLAGKSGTRCSDTCSRKCSWPKVCRYSQGVEFCDCPFGFHGNNCDEKVGCDEPDTGTAVKCDELVNRHRCNSADGKANCPHSCGHCLWLRQSGAADTKK